MDIKCTIWGGAYLRTRYGNETAQQQVLVRRLPLRLPHQNRPRAQVLPRQRLPPQVNRRQQVVRRRPLRLSRQHVRLLQVRRLQQS